MSVLFQALQKNTRNKDDAPSPRVIELRRLAKTGAASPNWKAIAILSLTFCGLSIGWATVNAGNSLLPAALADQPAAAPFAPPASLASGKLPEKAPRHAPPRSRLVDAAAEPQGIALPMEALTDPLDVTDQEQADITAIADRLPTYPKRSEAQTAPTKRLALSNDAAPNAADDAQSQATAAIKAGDYRKAYHWATQALLSAPHNAVAREIQLFALSQFPVADALEGLRKIEQNAAQDPQTMAKVQAALAQVQTKKGALRDAQASLWKAVAADPTNDSYRLSLAVLLDRLGDAEGALDIYRQIKTPLSPDIQQRMRYLNAKITSDDDESDPLKDES